MNKIKKGDQVVVITGKDKNASAAPCCAWSSVRACRRRGHQPREKHTKPNPMKGTQGGIVEKEMSIHISNLAIFNPSTGKADRVGFGTRRGGGGKSAQGAYFPFDRRTS